jgi:hypothetical protein
VGSSARWMKGRGLVVMSWEQTTVRVVETRVLVVVFADGAEMVGVCRARLLFQKGWR